MNKLQIISLISYSFIILYGQMIGIPFIIWLLYTCFDFGNSDQIFAVLGVIGFVINFTKYSNYLKFKILSLILMISPILKRIFSIQIDNFQYLAFIIPLFLFLITYLIFIVKPKKDIIKKET